MILPNQQTTKSNLLRNDGRFHHSGNELIERFDNLLFKNTISFPEILFVVHLCFVWLLLFFEQFLLFLIFLLIKRQECAIAGGQFAGHHTTRVGILEGPQRHNVRHQVTRQPIGFHAQRVVVQG